MEKFYHDKLDLTNYDCLSAYFEVETILSGTVALEEKSSVSKALSPSSVAPPPAETAGKSNRFRSSRCEGATRCRLLNMVSTRPGNSLSHCRSICFTCFLCRWSCEPHRSQGMIGNARTSAWRARSLSFTYASGRITTCLPSSEASFGGMAFSLPPKNRLRKKVSRM